MGKNEKRLHEWELLREECCTRWGEIRGLTKRERGYGKSDI